MVKYFNFNASNGNVFNTDLRFVNFFLLTLILFSFSCNSSNVEDSNTTAKEENTNKEEVATNSSETIDLKDLSTVEKIFFLMEDKDLGKEFKNKIFNNYKSDIDESLKIKKNVSTKINLINSEKGYLSYYISFGTGEGGGDVHEKSICLYQDDSSEENQLIAFTQTVSDGYYYSKSWIKFYRLKEGKLIEEKIDLPVLKRKDFFVTKADCNGESKFEDYLHVLPNNGQQTLKLKVSLDDEERTDCNSKTKEVVLKWDGTRFEKNKDNKKEFICTCEKKENNYICTYMNYRTVESMHEDYKGRGHSYSTLEKDDGKGYKSIKSGDLFDSGNIDFINELKKGVKSEYKRLLTEYPDGGGGCINEIRLKESYNLNDFSISFREDGIYFGIDFGFSSACLALDGRGFTISWEKVDKYIRQ
jgi:hypothetical protein